MGYQADYTQLLQNMVATNPEGATNFAKSLLEGQNGVPLIDINQVVKVFMDQNRLQETTSILLDALKANKPDQAHLQTQLLTMNLQQAPKVAEAILQMCGCPDGVYKRKISFKALLESLLEPLGTCSPTMIGPTSVSSVRKRGSCSGPWSTIAMGRT